MENSDGQKPRLQLHSGDKNQPEAVQDIMQNIRQDMADYHRAVKQAPHDPLKTMVAGMVNQKMLQETAEECEKAAEKTGMKAPDAKKLQEIQNWAHKYKKKHPLATVEQVQRAVSLHFNLMILPDDEPA